MICDLSGRLCTVPPPLLSSPPPVSLADRVKRQMVQKLLEWRPSLVDPSALLHHPETAVDTSHSRRVSRRPTQVATRSILCDWLCLGEYANWQLRSAEIRGGGGLA